MGEELALLPLHPVARAARPPHAAGRDAQRQEALVARHPVERRQCHRQDARPGQLDAARRLPAAGRVQRHLVAIGTSEPGVADPAEERGVRVDRHLRLDVGELERPEVLLGVGQQAARLVDHLAPGFTAAEFLHRGGGRATEPEDRFPGRSQ